MNKKLVGLVAVAVLSVVAYFFGMDAVKVVKDSVVGADPVVITSDVAPVVTQ